MDIRIKTLLDYVTNKLTEQKTIPSDFNVLVELMDLSSKEIDKILSSVNGSKQNELLTFLDWYIANRGRFNSSEPKYMVEEYLS
jgi:hypothetical protein